MFSARNFRIYCAIKDGEVEPPSPLPLKNLIEIDVLKTKMNERKEETTQMKMEARNS